MRYSVSGNKLSGTELNSASVFDTSWAAPKGAARIGAFINIASEDSSAGTLDVDIEFSPNGGTTAVGFPISANSETEASLAQFAATGSKYKWWEACVDGQYSRVRAELTQAALTASEGFTYGPSFWIFADVD
jgi:hypothetical protein